MDRSNGGNSLAPPRPPKLLPRVHRPRAPEPTMMMNETTAAAATITSTLNSTAGVAAATITTITTTSTIDSLSARTLKTPQCTNPINNHRNNRNNNNNNNNNNNSDNHLHSIEQNLEQNSINNLAVEVIGATADTSSVTNRTLPVNNNNNNNKKNNCNINNNNLQPNINSNINSSNITNNIRFSNNCNKISNSSNSSSGSKINRSNNNNLDKPILLPTTSPPAPEPASAPAQTSSSIETSTISLQPGDYQIHHSTLLLQRVTSNLRRNGSHISSLSSPSVTTSASTTAPSASSSSIIATNSFTRRRPQSPLVGAVTLQSMATATATTTAISGNNNNSSSNNNNNSSSSNNSLSHFHSIEPVATSPVTLAQPRPESERFVNEYVDTPLRNAHQLQHTTRIQHPAGQYDNGQTTTHHFLLLPQRELRQQQQQEHQQQQQHQHQYQYQLQLHQQIHPSNRLTLTAGSVNDMTGIDGIDGFLYSQNQQQQINSPHNKTASFSPTPTGGQGLGLGLELRLDTTTDKINTNFQMTPTVVQPIIKQPATSIKQSTCKFAKELPALDELLDFHNISTGIITPQGIVSAVVGASGANPLASSIIIGNGSEGPSSLNPITCQRCGRCRCEQCQSPRSLPQTWICNKTCLCSAESVIDYSSCLCCVKALFYHCACDNDLDCDDGSNTPCVDNPCSCAPYKRTQRWGWLGALSLVLPCLWCYWPMRGCATLCEKCYGQFAKRGCQCQHIGSTSSMLPIANSLNINGNNIIVLGNSSTIRGNGQGNITTKSLGHHHHHHHHSHHNDCSNAANRILRKSDPTPEKRLLDTSPEY